MCHSWSNPLPSLPLDGVIFLIIIIESKKIFSYSFLPEKSSHSNINKNKSTNLWNTVQCTVYHTPFLLMRILMEKGVSLCLNPYKKNLRTIFIVKSYVGSMFVYSCPVTQFRLNFPSVSSLFYEKGGFLHIYFLHTCFVHG